MHSLKEEIMFGDNLLADIKIKDKASFRNFAGIAPTDSEVLLQKNT
jgi:hypothetical protein